MGFAVFSKEEFDTATAWQKGYAVYMWGARKDQPNIPKTYKPTEEEEKEFKSGGFAALLVVMETEE